MIKCEKQKIQRMKNKERKSHLFKMAFEKSIELSDCIIANDIKRAEVVLKELERVLHVTKTINNTTGETKWQL